MQKPKQRKKFEKRVHRTERRPQKKAESRPPLPSSREAALFGRLTRVQSPSPRRHLLVQDLIYNTAQELQMLAFKSGFNVGAEVYRHSDKSMTSLERILENAGLGRVVFYPFESKSVISSRSIRSGGMNTGVNMHVFEAGVISGYLTAHARKPITVVEQNCVFNGASTCEFVATAGGIDSVEQPPLDFPAVLKALSRSISGSEDQKGNGAYYMVSIRPLLSEPVFGEATKLMYLAGKALAQELPDFERSVSRAATLLGVEKAKVVKDKKGEVSVYLGYTHDTSVHRYVELSTSMFAGMMQGAFGKGVKVTRSVDAKGFYNVRLRILRNPKEE